MPTPDGLASIGLTSSDSRGWVSTDSPSKIVLKVPIRSLLFELAFFDHAVSP